jgi:hypothetical protein
MIEGPMRREPVIRGQSGGNSFNNSCCSHRSRHILSTHGHFIRIDFNFKSCCQMSHFGVIYSLIFCHDYDNVCSEKMLGVMAAQEIKIKKNPLPSQTTTSVIA